MLCFKTERKIKKDPGFHEIPGVIISFGERNGERGRFAQTEMCTNLKIYILNENNPVG